MNCLEAQSKIMAFIENKLPDDELREIIKHVRSCKNCYEELDIYYTLIVGMKQLDESDNISTDFKNALDKHLEEEMNRLTTVKRIANSTILVGIAAVVAGLIWLYSGALDKVYNYEQNCNLNTIMLNSLAQDFWTIPAMISVISTDITKNKTKSGMKVRNLCRISKNIMQIIRVSNSQNTLWRAVNKRRFSCQIQVKRY